MENAGRTTSEDREHARSAEVVREIEARSTALAALKPKAVGPWVRVALPANVELVTRLPAERRAKFEAHLRSIVAQSSESQARGPEPVSTIDRAGSNPVDGLLAHACGTCRGLCCRQAGEKQAYLDADSVQACRSRNPGIRDGEIAAAYLSRIPEESYEGSCVFHGREGCALPRGLRSAMCDWFLCEPLIRLSRRVALERRAMVFAVAMRGLEPVRWAVFDADRVYL